MNPRSLSILLSLSPFNQCLFLDPSLKSLSSVPYLHCLPLFALAQFTDCKQAARPIWWQEKYHTFLVPSHQCICDHVVCLSPILTDESHLLQKVIPFTGVLDTIHSHLLSDLCPEIIPLSQASVMSPLLGHCHHQKNLLPLKINPSTMSVINVINHLS